MPLDRTNRSLYIDRTDPDNPLGITPQEIAECLQDYRVDKRGKVDVGMMCTSPKINGWAIYRPITSFVKRSKLTLEERASINYGYSIRPIAWNAENLAEEVSWMKWFNASALESYYRVDDFDGYNHLAKIPLEFLFEDGKKVYRLNTTFGFDLPNILVRYKLNDSIYSSGMEKAELSLELMNLDGSEYTTIGKCIPCVIASKDGGETYRVANGIKKLGDMTADNVDTMRIELAKFNIEDALGNASSEDYDMVPEGSSNVKSMLMYPKLNNYSDISNNRLYSDDPDTPFGNISWDDSMTKGNGFINQRSDALLPVPDGSPLKVVSFTFIPAKVAYTYASVKEDGVSTIGVWMFDPSDISAEDARIANLGGKTLHFSTKEVRVTVLMSITNIYDEDIYFKPSEMTFLGFTPTRVELGSATAGEYMKVAKGQTTSVYIDGVFEVGSRADYTFPSYTSPNFGTTSAPIYLKFGLTTDKYGSSIFPESDHTYVLRWR